MRGRREEERKEIKTENSGIKSDKAAPDSSSQWRRRRSESS